MNSFEEFDKLVRRFELDGNRGKNHELAVRLSGSTEVMWDCELRYTPTVNARGRGDYSFTVYVGGYENAERALAAALTEVAKWAREGFKRDVPGDSYHVWNEWVIEREKGIPDTIEDEEYPDPDVFESDCTPSFEGGYWSDPNDPTA